MKELGTRAHVSQTYRRRRLLSRLVLCVAFLLVLAANIAVAIELTTDEPNDGKLYRTIAVNLAEHGVFSAESEPPYPPTLIRLPGYPLFLAGIYESAGTESNSVVRVVQAVLYTASSVFAGLIAYAWSEDKKRRKRKAAWAAFFLAGLCPFAVIYSATLLTESLTIFTLSVTTLAATYALKTASARIAFAWWLTAGLLAGIGVLLRPDSGLFALGFGLTLIASIFLRRGHRAGVANYVLGTAAKCVVFTAAFAAVLLPWAIRNERVFGVFEPLAPEHAEAPGEFVPLGYFHWVRTWIIDERYIEPMLWNLEDKPIPIEAVPSSAFRTDEEKDRVAALLNAYNHSDPDHEPTDANDASNSGGDDTNDETGANNPNDDTDPTVADDDQSYDLKITPEVDAEFEKIAEERIKAQPIEYYLELPAERAAAMWFDTHSAYYPFSGELFPLKDLDGETGQNVWLPIFAALTWIYTLTALAGAFLLWRNRKAAVWLFLAAALCVPRVLFFSTLENPEPRYLAELFLIASILGGIFLSRFRFRNARNLLSLEFALPGKR